MHSFVIFQCCLHSECLSTGFTLKWLFMSVLPSDVNIKVELLLKHFITALMGTFSVCTNILRIHVSNTVLVQLCQRFELLGTLWT